MGSKTGWLMICIVWLWPLVGGLERYDSRDSLDSSIYEYALKKLSRPCVGRFCDVPLPARFSGMEVSVVRLRARGLWKKGVSYSTIEIPPSVLPWPFVRRVDLVCQNLGNWSSVYYKVPNYTLIAPVIGFLAYDPNRSSTSFARIELKIMGNDSFVVKFPNVSIHGNVGVKCVRLDTNGTLEFSNMTGKRSCVGRRQGHFSLVIPYELKGEANGKWWQAGTVIGVVGLVFLVTVGVVIYKWVKGKAIKKMERVSESSVDLGTIWIGWSRMPSAPVIRTQPVLENSSVP